MPPAAIAAGLGAAGIGSAIAGGIAGNNASKRAANTANAAAQGFKDINDPDYEAMRLKLEDLKSQGVITPEMEQAILQDPSQLQSYTEDPRLRQSELDALGQLSSISNEKGLDPQSVAALMQAQSSNGAAARGARDANLSNAAQRGVSGSGLEFVSNQLADQGAASQNAMTGTQAAADARAREMAALTGMSSIGSNLRSQDFGQAQAKAAAADDINRFNTQAKQAVQNTNVATANTSQAANLAEKQRLADQNALLHNSQQQYNSQIGQQKFQNDMAKASGAAGLAGTQANTQLAQGQSMQNMFGGIGQSLVGAGASVYANQNAGQYDPITGKKKAGY